MDHQRSAARPKVGDVETFQGDAAHLTVVAVDGYGLLVKTADLGSVGDFRADQDALIENTSDARSPGVGAGRHHNGAPIRYLRERKGDRSPRLGNRTVAGTVAAVYGYVEGLAAGGLARCRRWL